MEKKILDVTCGSRTIWFDKHHAAAIYCDRRRESYENIWKSTNAKSERSCVIDPDVLCDFTDLPFEDNSFSLVVFDPHGIDNIPMGKDSSSATEFLRGYERGAIETANIALGMIPVDAVEVVRCKECKHFTPKAGFTYIDGFCNVGNTTLARIADGYCNRGERREGE